MLFRAFQPQTTAKSKEVTSSERTRISYFTALAPATYVVLLKENHMQLTEAATLDRKFGEVEDVHFRRPLLGTRNTMLKQNCHLDRSASGVERPAVALLWSHCLKHFRNLLITFLLRYFIERPALRRANPGIGSTAHQESDHIWYVSRYCKR